MFIKIKKKMVGGIPHRHFAKDSIHDLPEDHAKKLIHHGCADAHTPIIEDSASSPTPEASDGQHTAKT